MVQLAQNLDHALPLRGARQPKTNPISEINFRNAIRNGQLRLLKTWPYNRTPDQILALIKEKLGKIDMSQPRAQQLSEVILSMQEAFLMKGCPIERLVNHEHKIEVEGKPFKEKQSRLGPKQREIAAKEIKMMLDMGVIERCESPWASRLLMVTKPDGSLRPCVDYRRLNSMTIRQNNPLPNIDDVLHNVSKGKVYTQIDLYSGFWQIPLREKDMDKTAFYGPEGLYRWKVMPFGLMNAPATFQSYMEYVLKDYLHTFVEVYIDDVVINLFRE